MRSTSSCDLHGGGWNGRSAVGCLSRMLRRILCFSSLPLRSFDHFKEDERETSQSQVINATPGVVARLMGLDSLLIQPGSFETPRRRDFPAYQELEDDNFFILSFEKRRESRRRKSPRIQPSVEADSMRENKESDNPENEKKKKITKLAKNKCLAPTITFENEDDPENSSPNSVLEFVGFSADQESASLGGISRLANSKMRRPLSEELENCRESKAKIVIDGLDLEGGNLMRSKAKIMIDGLDLVRLCHRSNSERLEEIGKMAAMETMGSRWLNDDLMQNKHCFMEISREIALDILDHLLEELVINS